MTYPIELLCPAKNAAIGIEAIRHGADAVYIGGPSFGARAAAGNSVEDIRQLCDYAHIYGARVYVTLNTILYDDELASVERLIHELYAAGVDALITQDLAILKLNIPPIALHASTQMDTCTPEKALFLEKAGYSQIVVARELSLDQLRQITNTVSVPIEAFVHGALCVSYSGRCYVSQHCFGRSANRGCCAQFCRLSFDLIDADGRVLSNKHHLSLRDMNRTNSIEQMLAAGVHSFKVEGRLKDEAYVKNVAAHYRKALDAILDRHTETYHRASYGSSQYSFEPAIQKTFNRGFTDYFLHGRKADVASPLTPKAIGARVGTVQQLRQKSFLIQSDETFANGDGLCFFDADGKLQGFRVNRAEGKELFPLQLPPSLRKGTELFRNEDRLFERSLEHSSHERVLATDLALIEQENGFLLCATTEHQVSIALSFTAELQEARTPQRDNIVRQLSKLGGTSFKARTVTVELSKERFIPTSVLNEWRRLLVEQLLAACRQQHQRDVRRAQDPHLSLEGQNFDYTANVSNALAQRFLEELGAAHVEPAYEITPATSATTLMTCKHCIRYAEGQCPRETKRPPQWKEPIALRASDGRVFPLTFDCVKCEMYVHRD